MLCFRQSLRSSHMRNAMVSSHTRIAYPATLRPGQDFLNAFLETRLAFILMVVSFIMMPITSSNEKHD